MKRLLGIILVLIVFIGMLSVTASAAIYTESFTNNLLDPIRTYLGDSNGSVVFYYEPVFLGVLPWATTTIHAPSGMVGRVYSFIACEDLEARSASAEVADIENNQMQCTADLRVHPYATRVSFYAGRSYGGVTNAWEYTYTSPGHPLP